MQVAAQPKPFTHLISHILVVVIAVYLAINVGIVSACVDSGIGSCLYLRGIPLPFEFIPAIKRPVAFLLTSGNADRAALVSELYSFAWLTGLITLAFMIAIAAVISLQTSDEERDETRRLIEIQAADYVATSVAVSRSSYRKHDLVSIGLGVIALATLIAFLYVFWGFYSFHTWSAYSNMVHVRNRDFFLMSVGWSGLLVVSMLYIMAAIQRFILGMPASHRIRGSNPSP